jgi:hypothetical protein
MLTGKAAFDVIASTAQQFVGQDYTRGGLTYRLTFIASVTGPYSATCTVSGIFREREIVAAGVDALVVRYSVAASGNRPGVDPQADMRVLTAINLPSNPTSADLAEVARQFLEDAR